MSSDVLQALTGRPGGPFPPASMSAEALLADLTPHETGAYSQAGEEGVLRHIFSAIGTTNRVCVEFGAWDGLHYSNTARFRIEDGWTGLLLEGDPEKSQADGVVHALVTAENVETLFEETRCAARLRPALDRQSTGTSIGSGERSSVFDRGSS